MKKIISNFGNTVLSREQMKEVTGGLMESCAVCSAGPLGGTCGTFSLNIYQAKDLERELNASNDGYSYYTQCYLGG